MIDSLEFIVARYNYWIVIILMMTGLYTVIARGNLVKKIIGLNVFQTSVFIFYITIGKISGGTAPIYVPGDMEARTDHGGGHAAGHADGPEAVSTGAQTGHGNGVSIPPSADQSSIHSMDKAIGEMANDLVSSTAGAVAHDDTIISQHDVDASANAMLTEPAISEFHIGEHAAAPLTQAASHGGDVAAAVTNIIYSNPLPHVLILTAIVVGVATTAVGLALAVRIREAYGTIEEDELEALDNIAEFGEPVPNVKAAE